MITGVLIILVGEWLLTGVPAIGWWAILFFMINTVYFYFVEEPALLRRFGAPYKNYRRRVPRWIPRLSPYMERDSNS